MSQHESSSSGCATSCGSQAEPIACRLTGREQHMQRVADFAEAFGYLKRTEPFIGGFRWYFEADAAQEAFLRDLAQRESECCRFFDFGITREGRAVIWETRAPHEATEVLAAFRRLPETLKELPTEDALKTAFGAAGLKFEESSEDPR